MNNIQFYIDMTCNDDDEFNSGHEVFDEYFKNHNDSSVMHYIYDAENEKIAAYFSLISSAMLSNEKRGIGAIPAIELKMFALDKGYQGKKIAPLFLNTIIKLIKHYSIDFVGAKVILLYSVPIGSVIRLYESCGFYKADDSFATYKSDFNEGCVPMFKLL